MNTPVSFSIAKLLKEKGFDKICQNLWHFNSSNCIKMPNKNSENFGFSAPTIAEVVMWLYEKYGIWISVFKYKDHAADVNDPWLFRNQFDRGEYLSPTEAYEVGIRYALDNLIREEKK